MEACAACREAYGKLCWLQYDWSGVCMAWLVLIRFMYGIIPLVLHQLCQFEAQQDLWTPQCANS